jgi:hypothetical protein
LPKGTAWRKRAIKLLGWQLEGEQSSLVLELEFKWDFRTGTKTFVEKKEVATLYESERQLKQAKSDLPAAWAVCSYF